MSRAGWLPEFVAELAARQLLDRHRNCSSFGSLKTRRRVALPTQELSAQNRVSPAACTSDTRFGVLAHSDGADHALDRFCLMALVDAHLDHLLVFGWGKSRVHTASAGTHRTRVLFAVEAISCPYSGRVRTFTFASHLGLGTSIEAYCSYWIGRSRSGCLRRRGCGSISFRYCSFQQISYPPNEPGKLAHQRANGRGEITIVFGGAKNSSGD